MKNLNRIILLLLTVVVFASCDKKEEPPYTTDNLISFCYSESTIDDIQYWEYKSPLIFDVNATATEYQFVVMYDPFVEKVFRPLQATVKVVAETSTAVSGTDYTIAESMNLNFTPDNGVVRIFTITALPTATTGEKVLNLILDYGCEADFPIAKRTENTLKIILKHK